MSIIKPIKERFFLVFAKNVFCSNYICQISFFACMHKFALCNLLACLIYIIDSHSQIFTLLCTGILVSPQIFLLQVLLIWKFSFLLSSLFCCWRVVKKQGKHWQQCFNSLFLYFTFLTLILDIDLYFWQYYPCFIFDFWILLLLYV